MGLYGRGETIQTGGIEAGGSRFVCALGSGPDSLDDVVEIPTQDPESTLREVANFFKRQRAERRGQRRIGVGSFGPLDLNRKSPGYGNIMATPKQGWQNFPLLSELRKALEADVVIDTDVNAAALGEKLWGAGQGCNDFLYVTVGTELGVGAVVGGHVLRGINHPEMGHMLLPISEYEKGSFKGNCPFHGQCAEGLAAGPAVLKRWGKLLNEMPPDHLAWKLQSDYLATFLANLTFILQPQKIIVGGGVASPQLLEMVRVDLHRKLAGYRPSLAGFEAMHEYVVSPRQPNRSGVLGAIAMARG